MLKEIEINGKKYPVAFTFNALDTFGQLTGMSVSEMERISTSMTFGHIKALTFAGLKDGNRLARKEDNRVEVFDATLEDIGDWLSENPAVFAEIFTSFADAQARPVESKKKEVPVNP